MRLRTNFRAHKVNTKQLNQAAARLTKPPHCAVIAPLVRKTLAAIIALILIWIGWSVWPFVGLFDLAHDVQSGDVDRIEARVDYPALGRSLSAQIIETYVRLSGAPVDRSLLLGLATSVADPMVARLVSRVALGQLLQNGWPKDVLGERPMELPAPDWNALGTAWQLYANSEYGLGTFQLRLPADRPAARQFRVHLALHGLTWKLTGFDLPRDVLDRLARELMQRKSG